MMRTMPGWRRRPSAWTSRRMLETAISAVARTVLTAAGSPVLLALAPVNDAHTTAAEHAEDAVRPDAPVRT